MNTGEVALGTRQIYILPTRPGLLFTLVLAALLIAAVNYANALAYLFTFLLTGLALVSLLHTQRNLLGLRLTATGTDPVFAGESAAFHVCVHNRARVRTAVRLECPGIPVMLFDVPALDTYNVTLAVPATRRGWLDCPAFVLATHYPLGIARAWSRRIALPARCLVYPEPAAAAALPRSLAQDSEGAGGVTRDGDDFAGLRAYQPGDAASRISWKTLARGQGLYTKEFRAPRAESIWLDWEAFTPLAAETRLSLLCRATLEAEDSGRTYGLRLPGVVLEPDNGALHRHRCLEALALHETVA
jgi:uncharacterized protein (DUF58 family)